VTIDWWTLGLETVNVVVLIWLLRRFFWRPLADTIEQRRKAMQATLAEAEAKSAEAKTALTEIEKTRARFVDERDAILAAAHTSAEQARTLRLEETAKDVAVLETTAKSAIEKDRDAAEASWADRSSRLAVDIAGRLAARLDGPAIRATFLDWLLNEIRTLPDAQRHAMAGKSVLDAVSAAPLEPAEQERTRSLIAEAFGGHPEIAFKVDAALIGGLELHAPDFRVTSSWRAGLSRILADLTRVAGH